MMPDLGKYAISVLSAYAASLTMLAVLVLVTLRQGRAARRALSGVESERGKDG
ncbi:MAG: heme exporter protein CcmD [Pseudomonadota bacterium]